VLDLNECVANQILIYPLKACYCNRPTDNYTVRGVRCFRPCYNKCGEYKDL